MRDEPIEHLLRRIVTRMSISPLYQYVCPHGFDTNTHLSKSSLLMNVTSRVYYPYVRCVYSIPTYVFVSFFLFSRIHCPLIRMLACDQAFPVETERRGKVSPFILFFSTMTLLAGYGQENNSPKQRVVLTKLLAGH